MYMHLLLNDLGYAGVEPKLFLATSLSHMFFITIPGLDYNCIYTYMIPWESS